MVTRYVGSGLVQHGSRRSHLIRKTSNSISIGQHNQNSYQIDRKIDGLGFEKVEKPKPKKGLWWWIDFTCRFTLAVVAIASCILVIIGSAPKYLCGKKKTFEDPWR